MPASQRPSLSSFLCSLAVFLFFVFCIFSESPFENGPCVAWLVQQQTESPRPELRTSVCEIHRKSLSRMHLSNRSEARRRGRGLCRRIGLWLSATSLGPEASENENTCANDRERTRGETTCCFCLCPLAHTTPYHTARAAPQSFPGT